MLPRRVWAKPNATHFDIRSCCAALAATLSSRYIETLGPPSLCCGACSRAGLTGGVGLLSASVCTKGDIDIDAFCLGLFRLLAALAADHSGRSVNRKVA